MSGRYLSTVAILVVVACVSVPAVAKLEPGAGCSDSKDHCDAPKSGMNCCVGNTKCYSAEDCASFLKTCPFSDDTKKGESLANCLGKDAPKSSDFKKGACSAEIKGKLKDADGKTIPLKANATCFQSEKVTCEVYKNATGHSFISVTCKNKAKKASSARTASASLWQGCVLLALLVAGVVAVLGLHV